MPMNAQSREPLSIFIEFVISNGYLSRMRRLFCGLLVIGLVGLSFSIHAATGRVMKVLPHFLDFKGRHTLSPSLFERDAYQAQLRQNPKQRSAIRFDIQWKLRGAAFESLKLRVELRGAAQGNLPVELVLEKPVEREGRFSQWTALILGGDEYRNIGEVTAWRVTLWDGAQLLGEQKSFLW